MKKILSIFICVVILISCIGAVSVSADELIKVGTYTMSNSGFGYIKAEDHDYYSPNKWSAYKILYQRSSDTAGDPVETKDNLMFFKFDVSEMNLAEFDFMEKAELSFYFNGRREQDLRIYPVQNDDWTTSTLTWNTVYGREADVENEIEAISASYLPDSEYVSYYLTRTGSSVLGKLVTIDITDILEKGYAEDGVLSFAMGTYSKAEQSGMYYHDAFKDELSYSKPFISIYQKKPELKVSQKEYTIEYSDHGMIRPTAPGTVHELISSGTRYEPGNGDLSDPYGVDDAVYLKFDLSALEGEIDTATFYFDSSGRRTWNAHLYPVENDNWTHSTLTFNSAYGVEAVEGDPETGDGAVEAQPALYAPENEPLEFTVSTSGSASPAETNITTEVDVTDLIKSLTVNDDIASFAFMLHTTSSSNSFYFKVNTTNKPRLVITTKPAEVTFGQSVFKVNGVTADTLEGESGIVSAEFEASSTLLAPTRATTLMAVYEGERLVKIFTNQQVVNDKDTNGGVTTVSVTSPETIEFTENTKVKAFVWGHKQLINQPVAPSIVIE